MRTTQTKKQSAPKPVMKAKEVAEHLGFSTRWVYEMARTGKLPCFRVASYPRFYRKDIENLGIEDSADGATPPPGKIAGNYGRGMDVGGMELRLRTSRDEIRCSECNALAEIIVSRSPKCSEHLASHQEERTAGGGWRASG
jgi:predicted DNA-binding transcriptional regulator AlpA